MFFTRISEIKRKKSESYIGFDKSTSTLEERLQAHLRRLSPYPFGSAGKGLERETLCPFPRVRRFGTHSETGSKFLLLFSIKSKEEILCFAERVPNGRSTDVAREKLGASAPIKKGAFQLLFYKFKIIFPHPLWFLQYNPRHAPQTHPCPHSRIPQQCRESQWHARPQCQISCPQS